MTLLILVDVSDIFYFFCARGGVRGSPRRRGEGGGSVFLLKIPGGGGGSSGRGRWGWEGVRIEFGNFGGRGLNIFFFGGPKCPPSNLCTLEKPSFWQVVWIAMPTANRREEMGHTHV